MTNLPRATDRPVVRIDETPGQMRTAVAYYPRHRAEPDRPPLVRTRTADYQPRHAAPDGGE